MTTYLRKNGKSLPKTIDWFFLSNAVVETVRVQSMPSRLFSLRLMFECSKSQSLRDVSVTRIGDTLSYCCPQTVGIETIASSFRH